VTTLIASKKEGTARLAGLLGFSWGLGHATSLFAFGLPIVLYRLLTGSGSPGWGNVDRPGDRRARGLAARSLAPRHLPHP
jgi:hypothetical protein